MDGRKAKYGIGKPPVCCRKKKGWKWMDADGEGNDERNEIDDERRVLAWHRTTCWWEWKEDDEKVDENWKGGLEESSFANICQRPPAILCLRPMAWRMNCGELAGWQWQPRANRRGAKLINFTKSTMVLEAGLIVTTINDVEKWYIELCSFIELQRQIAIPFPSHFWVFCIMFAKFIVCIRNFYEHYYILFEAVKREQRIERESREFSEPPISSSISNFSAAAAAGGKQSKQLLGANNNQMGVCCLFGARVGQRMERQTACRE
jgi:hypothetical protein